MSMRGMLLGQRDINEFDDNDRLQTVVDFYEDIKEKGEGFPVLSYSLGLPKKKQYTVRLYINNDIHEGADHGGKVTNAQLAAMFFYGKWSGWWGTTVLPALRGILAGAQHNIVQLTSQQAKKERAEYNRSIAQWKHSSEFKSFLSLFKGRFGVGDTINTLDENNKPITLPLEKFIKISKLHTRARGWTRQMEEEYAAAKKDQWYAKSIPRIRSVEERDPLLAQLIVDPYKYGAFVKGVIQQSASAARDKVVEFILGAKHPEIEIKTKYNRRWRGYPDNPPLKETGDFAESVEYDII